MTRAFVILALLGAVVACRSPEDRARAEFQARLGEPGRLSDTELWRLAALSVDAMGDRIVRARDGVNLRLLESRDRATTFALFSGNVPLEDGGVRRDGSITMRGLRGPGTPIHSEVDAEQTLWIDVDTLLPTRFELTFSMPGMGDAAYDLVFGR